MTASSYRNGTAAATSIILVALALAAAWLMIAPAILGPDSPTLTGPLATSEAETAAAPLIEGIRVSESFQVSQPRDPFRPLITEDSPLGPGGGGDFDPNGTRVALLEIRDVGGTLRAQVSVDGVVYDVGEGESFADNFMVVSLETDCGVFLYGDNAFELCVGEEILK